MIGDHQSARNAGSRGHPHRLARTISFGRYLLTLYARHLVDLADDCAITDRPITVVRRLKEPANVTYGEPAAYRTRKLALVEIA